MTKLKKRERQAILDSLRAGVVPRIGLQHIQVGRKDEVAALLSNLDSVKDGSAAVRFIIGRFGTGKSFLLNLMQTVALEQGFVVVHADMSTQRRLHSTSGQARALYAELMRNLSTRTKPTGGALPSVVERWVADIDHRIRASGGDDNAVLEAIQDELKELQDHVSGYDFAKVVAKYFSGYLSGDDALMAAALRWLRAEYSTKTEAKQDLDVRSIITDATFYDYLKLMAAFVRLAGYSGLLVCFDEMGVLSHRLNNALARRANFDVILQIVNDCLQGSASGIAFFLAGTDDFLNDRRRGLYSSEALATRLAANAFAGNGLKDMSNPVVTLSNLTPEELYVLLVNIRNVFASGDPAKYLLPDEGLTAFMSHCNQTLGAEFFKTPRDSVKAFVSLMSVLEQNPGADWRGLLDSSITAVEVSSDPISAIVEDEPSFEEDQDDDLTSFRL